MSETSGQKAFRREVLNALQSRCTCGRKLSRFKKCCKLCGGNAILPHTTYCDRVSSTS